MILIVYLAYHTNNTIEQIIKLPLACICNNLSNQWIEQLVLSADTLLIDCIKLKRKSSRHFLFFSSLTSPWLLHFVWKSWVSLIRIPLQFDRVKATTIHLAFLSQCIIFHSSGRVSHHDIESERHEQLEPHTCTLWHPKEGLVASADMGGPLG